MMESMRRWAIRLLSLALLVGAGLYVAAGRGAPPSLSILQPVRMVGQNGTLEVIAGAPGGRFTSLTITLEQGGRQTDLFSLEMPGTASIAQIDADQLRIARPLGKQSVSDLLPGPARIVVAASRPALLNLRTLSSTTSSEIEVRLEPPRIAVVSTHHYVNHGGSEMVVYRVTPPDVRSGVRVGDVEYAGYPAAAAGVAGADPALRVAFFALLFDQELTAPIAVFASDEAGNESRVPFVDQVFARPARRSRIALEQPFLERVVPEIARHSPELNIPVAADDLLPGFLAINGPLRQANADQIARISAETTASKLWDGAFAQLGNSQVEAGFADHRTYFYEGREVDRQVHLGFDLAVTAAVPIVAANAGRVQYAGWLGIYGNCVIVDHGLGVGSLYAHLSSVEVAAGDMVTKGQGLGRSGMTGLAGGDHLHFTMLVAGHPVNPVEWWDPGWIRDRIDRKLAAAVAGDGA
jgi:murein DD-endopeptidase MepM/ murein hydrolase activator NlpD